MGMPALVYRWLFRAHSLKSLERNILGFRGIRPIRETLIGTVEGSAATRGRWLEESACSRRARRAGRRFRSEHMPAGRTGPYSYISKYSLLRVRRAGRQEAVEQARARDAVLERVHERSGDLVLLVPRPGGTKRHVVLHHSGREDVERDVLPDGGSGMWCAGAPTPIQSGSIAYCTPSRHTLMLCQPKPAPFEPQRQFDVGLAGSGDTAGSGCSGCAPNRRRCR